jgi:hypothetical protein
LPKIPTNTAKIILYADDTNVIPSHPSPQDFKININKVFVDINEWFPTNLLLLNKKLIIYDLRLNIV